MSEWLALAVSGGALFMASTYEAMKQSNGDSSNKKKAEHVLAQEKYQKLMENGLKHSEIHNDESLVLCPPLNAESYRELQTELNKLNITSKFESIINEEAGINLQGLVLDLRFLLPNYPTYADERVLSDRLEEVGLILASGESLLLRQLKYPDEKKRKPNLRPGFFVISSPLVANNDIVKSIVARLKRLIAKNQDKLASSSRPTTAPAATSVELSSSSKDRSAEKIDESDQPRKKQKTDSTDNN